MEGDVLERQPYAEIATGNHHRVGASNDRVKIVDRLSSLDLRDQHGARVPNGVTYRIDVFGLSDK